MEGGREGGREEGGRDACYTYYNIGMFNSNPMAPQYLNTEVTRKRRACASHKTGIRKRGTD